jgi:hypothetical protein
MAMPMRRHIHPLAIRVPAVVPFDGVTVPTMGDERRLLAYDPEGDLCGAGPLIVGRGLGHDRCEYQQDEAGERDDPTLHGYPLSQDCSPNDQRRAYSHASRQRSRKINLLYLLSFNIYFVNKIM